MTIVWLAAALLLGIAEVLSVDLFFLTLALASLTGAGAALLGLPVWGQLAVVVIASIIMLIFIRPWAKAHLQRSTPDIDTNARGLVGKVAVVTAPLVGTAGRVRLDGGDWSARAEGGVQFPVGTQVRVVMIDGATAVVGPLQEEVPVPPDSEPPDRAG